MPLRPHCPLLVRSELDCSFTALLCPPHHVHTTAGSQPQALPLGRSEEPGLLCATPSQVTRPRGVSQSTFRDACPPRRSAGGSGSPGVVRAACPVSAPEPREASPTTAVV